MSDLQNPEKAMELLKKTGGTRNWMKKHFSVKPSPRWARLSGSLKSYRIEIERRLSLPESIGTEWAVNLVKVLDQCQNQLDAGEIDEAWKSFDAARRLELFGMDKNELQQRAKILRQEVSKLSEWRKRAIYSIIGDPDHPIGDEITAETLYEATLVRDEDFNNTYYKNRLIRRLFRLLFNLLVFWAVLIFVYFFIFNSLYENTLGTTSTDGVYLIGILLFGLLGATTSSILLTRQKSTTIRITEISGNQYVTLSRIFVGAAFSVFIFLILRSEIAENINLFSFKIQKPLDYFAIAFVSGFAERLAKNTIEALAGKEN